MIPMIVHYRIDPLPPIPPMTLRSHLIQIRRCFWSWQGCVSERPSWMFSIGVPCRYSRRCWFSYPLLTFCRLPAGFWFRICRRGLSVSWYPGAKADIEFRFKVGRFVIGYLPNHPIGYKKPKL